MGWAGGTNGENKKTHKMLLGSSRVTWEDTIKRASK
jgi:hypothetical protein